MDNESIQRILTLMPIFQPLTAASLDEGRRGLVHFAYYTSAETALKIVRDKTLWMRDARCMNDHSEVRASYRRVCDSASTRKFLDTLEHIGADIAVTSQKVLQQFETVLEEVYLCCLSRHPDTERKYGRLSMWRAYSGDIVGAALVLNMPWDIDLARAAALRVMAAPVFYCDQAKFDQHMEVLAENVRQHADQLRGIPPIEVVVAAASALLMLSIASKHLGFKEEQEWRFAYAPRFPPISKLLRCEIEIVGGMPQRVQKLELKDFPEFDAKGFAFGDIFEEVIIGPCSYSETIATAFADALDDAGISNAAGRVIRSDIPIRTKN